MTAEVVVANKLGIALAADSAVTIGGQKIYTSAEKLFSLSKIAPFQGVVDQTILPCDFPISAAPESL